MVRTHSEAAVPTSISARATSFRSIQALRGIAALSVVGDHIELLWNERLHPERPVHLFNGTVGVDLFFVISGFIIVIAAAPLLSKANGWRSFLARRFTRIVPVYWFYTTIKLIALLALPSMSLHGAPTVWHTFASYMLIPAKTADGIIQPILAVGWTLSFEMFFYLFVALALFLRVDILKLIAPIFIGLCVLALYRTPEWPTISIFCNVFLLEFLFGVVVGYLTMAGWRMPIPVAAVLTVVGLIALFTLPVGPAFGNLPEGVPGTVTLRPLTWGGASFVLVLSAVSIEPAIRAYLPRLLLNVGDSSYSIYLSHSLVLPPFGVLFYKLMPSVSLGLLFVAGFILCIIVGLLSYYFLERPLLRLGRAKSVGASAVPVAVSTAG